LAGTRFLLGVSADGILKKMTTIKLPKSVRRYVQPRDQEHEAWLSLLWQMYRRSFSKGHVDSFGSASELEEAILGHVYEIPKEKWPSFRPKQRRVTMRDVFRQIRSFSQPTKPKQRSTKQVVKKAIQKQSTIIRRPRPNETP